MAAKAILVLCAQALIAQSVYCHCLGGLATPHGLTGRDWAYDCLAYDGLGLAGRGWGCGGVPNVEYTATSGGGLPVTSASPVSPVGLTVTSENVYEGRLAAAGELPFVGTIAVDGALPTAGSGAINYGCGNGVTAMVSETIPSAAAFSPAATLAAPAIGAYGAGIGAYGAGFGAYGAGIAGPLGYGAGWAGPSCGCGF